MKNAIIFHGSGTTPEAVWHPWLKTNLEKKGYKVSIPVLNSYDPAKLNIWLPLALKEKYNTETILVGHSSGAPLILSVLENLVIKIKQAILIAGFISPLPADKGENPILQDSYNWQKIKDNVEDIIFINSVNDPWGCDDKQGRRMFEKLGGTLIINNEGHMGSDKYNQPYKEFPFLLKLIK